MIKTVLLRHGQSQWNLENRFTGWTDVDLSPQGVNEAMEAGKRLRTHGYSFDAAYTSVLKRCIRTLWIVLDAMDLMWIPATNDWRLNERHYGALQGLDKSQIRQQYGAEQFQQWRRGYATRPPALNDTDPRHPRHDPRYARLDPGQLPATESLQDTLQRVIPYWEENIIPCLRRQQRLLIVAHGNSLRALIKHLDGISDEAIPGLEIPTGVPLVYEFDDALRVQSRYYLNESGADQSAAARRG